MTKRSDVRRFASDWLSHPVTVLAVVVLVVNELLTAWGNGWLWYGWAVLTASALTVVLAVLSIALASRHPSLGAAA